MERAVERNLIIGYCNVLMKFGLDYGPWFVEMLNLMKDGIRLEYISTRIMGYKKKSAHSSSTYANWKPCMHGRLLSIFL